MTAATAVCFIFAGILIAASIEMPLNPLLSWTLVAIAAYPFLCGVLFIVCGIPDFRLMRRSLEKSMKEEAMKDGSPSAPTRLRVLGQLQISRRFAEALPLYLLVSPKCLRAGVAV
jgi:hypothetical protein